jgi:hypothetical protein
MLSSSTADVPAPLTRGLLERIKNILLSPRSEWPVIAAEPSSIGKLYIGYAIPLAAFAATMSIVHMSVVGVSLPFGGVIRTPVAIAAPYMVMSFVFGLIGLLIEALIVNALAPSFSGQRNLLQAFKTAAYAFTPVWLSTAFGLLPSFSTLLQLLAAIYGLCLLYKGLAPVMRSPPEKSFGYTASVVIVAIVVGAILGAVMLASGGLSRIIGMTGVGATGSPRSELTQEQGAATVGNVIGGMLGTDDKGKAGISAALSNLAKAGEQIQSQQDAANSAAATAATAPAVSTPQDSQDSAQNAGAAVGGLLTALGGALGGNRRVEPVNFQSLKALLPASLPGMQRTGTQGSQQQAVGVKSSSASAQYQGSQGAHVEIKISDMSGVSGLMDLAGALDQNSESESDTGYEKDSTVNGRRVHEKYDNPSRHGELSVILAKRFEVDVSGDSTDMSALLQDLLNVDLDRLEAMKDAGAQLR